MQLKILLSDKVSFSKSALFHCFLLPEENGPTQRTLLSCVTRPSHRSTHSWAYILWKAVWEEHEAMKISPCPQEIELLV